MVSVTKQGPFTRSGPETADEVTIDNFFYKVFIEIYILRLKYSEERRT